MGNAPNIMQYDTAKFKAMVMSDDYSGDHLNFIPEGRDGRIQLADDMDPEDVLPKLKQKLLAAPAGLAWYVTRTFQHTAGWSLHAAVGIRCADGIFFWDLDGAEGDDWQMGPSYFRKRVAWKVFFGEVGKDDNDPMDFTDGHHFCAFLPMVLQCNITDAEQVMDEPNMQNYHYQQCNCTLYAINVFVKMRRGFSDTFLQAYIAKVLTQAHTSLLDAGDGAAIGAAGGAGAGSAVGGAVFALSILGGPIGMLIGGGVAAATTAGGAALGAGGGAAAGGILEAVVDGENMGAFPSLDDSSVCLQDFPPVAFPTYVAQVD